MSSPVGSPVHWGAALRAGLTKPVLDVLWGPGLGGPALAGLGDGSVLRPEEIESAVLEGEDSDGC